MTFRKSLLTAFDLLRASMEYAFKWIHLAEVSNAKTTLTHHLRDYS